MIRANRELDTRWVAHLVRLAAVSNPCSANVPACEPPAESGQMEYARSQTACLGLWWPK